MKTHGLERYIQQCQDEVGRLIILDETVPLQHADYIVVFLGRNGISMIGLSEEKPARAAYDAISNEWPKVLIRQRDSVVSDNCKPL